MIKICKYCNKEFETAHSYKEHCSSLECKKRYHFEKSYIISKCELCGNEIIYRKSKPKRFCSKKCANHSDDVIQKMITSQRNTYLNKYGVFHPMLTTDVKSKFNKTMMSKYGVKCALQNKELYDKHKQTKFVKYGNQYYCNSDKIIKQLHTNQYDKLVLYFKSIGVEMMFDMSEYNGNEYSNIYKFRCVNCGNVFESNLYNLNSIFCKLCNDDKVYSYQKDILLFLNELLGKDEIIHVNNRQILNGKELDFYIPNHNFAIEFDGLYWHSEVTGNKNNNYHINKTIKCAEKNIKLIHIFENEWLFWKEKVKSVIKSQLGKIDNNVYARNLTVVNIDNNVKNSFLEKNHLQGRDNSSVRLALVNSDNKLMSVMTFSKPRFNVKYEWEIYRFANLLNTNVIGGASKLFTYFIKHYNPTSIITYSDKRYFDGNVYNIINFKELTDTKPNYWYVDNKSKKLYSRLKFQKHKLKKILDVYDDNLTEWQNMQLNGYDRIWDCGNKKFIWEK